MSMHKKPLTDLEREGLYLHHFDIGTPSQLSDAFRLGMAWVQKQSQAESERDALAAHNAALLSAIDGIRGTGKRSGFGCQSLSEVKAERLAWMRLNEVTSSAPQPCLREIKATAVLQFAARLFVKSNKNIDIIDEAKQEADEIRAGETK